MTDLIPPGIYLGMAAEVYHRDPALGSTSRKALAADAVEFQYARLRPPRPDTPSLIWGQALHARVLEGRDVFERSFKVKPKVENYAPPVLVTMDDLRAYAREREISPLPKTKDAMIEAILNDVPFDENITIWDSVMERFDQDPRTAITEDIAAEIAQAAQWMQADEKVGSIMEDGCFVGGHPEISIFYEKEGVRLKARLDYLLSHTIVDLKSFRPWSNNKRSIDAEVIAAIASYRYDLQALAYIEAWKAAREMFSRDSVISLDERINKSLAVDLLARSFAENEFEPAWTWVFLKGSGAPQPKVVQWTRKNSPFAFGSAEADIDTALLRYREYRDRYGDDKPWPPTHKALVIHDTDWPVFFGAK